MLRRTSYAPQLWRGHSQDRARDTQPLALVAEIIETTYGPTTGKGPLRKRFPEVLGPTN